MLRNSILAAALALVAVACTQNSAKPGFTIDGTVGRDISGIAYLYVLLPEYQELMAIDSATVKNGGFRMTGSVDEPMEAFLKIKGDTSAYCLVLTNNSLTMSIGDGTYSVQGSPSNRVLSQLLADKAAFVKRRESLQSDYKRMAADSTLTKPVEDSLMVAYHQAGVDYRRRLLSRLTKEAPRYPLMGRMALRIFSRDMFQQEVDSVSQLLKQPR